MRAALVLALSLAEAAGPPLPSSSPSRSPARSPTASRSSSPAPSPYPTPLWAGTHGSSERRNGLAFAGPQAAPAQLGATGPLGKTHGAVAVDVDDNIFFTAWNSSGPFLYCWHPTSELAAVAAGPSAGADIMSDSIDALLLGDGLAFVHLSYYNTSCDAALCSLTAAFHTPSLAPAWTHWPTGPLSSSALSPRVGLVTLSSRDRTLRVLAPTTGELSGPAIKWYTGQCDSFAGLAMDAGGATAFVSCADATFGHPHIYAFDLVRRAQLWSAELPVATGGVSWPPPLAFWRGALASQSFVVSVTDHIVTAAREDGEAAWTARLPATAHFVLDFAIAQRGGGGGADPLLLLLVQADDTAQTVRLLTYNASGLPVSPPFVLPLRVDRFLGSLLADPDGATVYVNGWDAASRPAGALKVVAARLTAGADGARAWATLWTTAPTPEGAAAGRYTFTGAQRRDGSLVFSGWHGAFLFG